MASESNQYATSMGSVRMAGGIDRSAEKLRPDEEPSDSGVSVKAKLYTYEVSKGLSKRQHAIVALLRKGPLFTSEVCAEITGAECTAAKHRHADCQKPGMLCRDHENAMFTVRRALESLHRRGLVDAEYMKDSEKPRGWNVLWTVKP